MPLKMGKIPLIILTTASAFVVAHTINCSPTPGIKDRGLNSQCAGSGASLLTSPLLFAFIGVAVSIFIYYVEPVAVVNGSVDPTNPAGPYPEPTQSAQSIASSTKRYSKPTTPVEITDSIQPISTSAGLHSNISAVRPASTTAELTSNNTAHVQITPLIQDIHTSSATSSVFPFAIFEFLKLISWIPSVAIVLFFATKVSAEGCSIEEMPGPCLTDPTTSTPISGTGTMSSSLSLGLLMATLVMFLTHGP